MNDSIMITDKNMTLGEYKKTVEYAHNLDYVLRDVEKGQHLRFIGGIYRTHEVCVIAVKNSPRHDTSSVPKNIRSGVLKEVLAARPTIFDIHLNGYDNWLGVELTEEIREAIEASK